MLSYCELCRKHVSSGNYFPHMTSLILGCHEQRPRRGMHQHRRNGPSGLLCHVNGQNKVIIAKGCFPIMVLPKSCTVIAKYNLVFYSPFIIIRWLIPPLLRINSRCVLQLMKGNISIRFNDNSSVCQCLYHYPRLNNSSF